MISLIGDDDELHEMLQAPLVKSLLLQISAKDLAMLGHKHPMGEKWRGYQDIDPGTLTRDRVLEFMDKVDPKAILAMVPHGTPQQVAETIKGYCEAGLRVPKILDYGGMAGLKYGALSAQKVRDAEDALLAMTGDLT